MNAKEVNEFFNIPTVLIETDANVCFLEMICMPERIISVLNQCKCSKCCILQSKVKSLTESRWLIPNLTGKFI